MSAGGKPTLAVWKFASCDGCQLSLLDCEDELLALADRGVAAERTYVSLERSMKCGVGQCGHCQLGPTLVCLDGPVYSWAEMSRWLSVREL